MKNKPSIKKVAVIGSGIMGSRIACHMANIGLDVLLLDIAPFKLNDAEEKAGLTLEHPKVKNRIVKDALKATLKSKPASLYKKDFISRIKTGNLSDDIEKISDADWIIEVVVERLDIKKQVLEKVEQFRKPESIISSNTSGIPIHMMLEDRSPTLVVYPDNVWYSCKTEEEVDQVINEHLINDRIAENLQIKK